MKKIIKRTVAAVLVTVMLFGSAPVWNMQAEAASYDPALPLPAISADDRTAVVKIALSQEGYRDKNGNSVYGAWYASKFNNSYFTSAAWCAMFVSWCFEQAGASYALPQYTARAHPSYYGFKKGTNYFSYSGNMIDVGDLIFVNWYGDSTDSAHVGLVYAEDSQFVYTIEGNTGRPNWGVYRRQYHKSNGKRTDGSGYLVYLAKPNYKGSSVNIGSSGNNAKASITVSDLSCPTQIKQGNAFYFKGIISANKPITSAGIRIENSSGETISYATQIITPNSYRIDISKEIDPDLHMSRLPVGNYNYYIFASCEPSAIILNGIKGVSYSGQTLKKGSFSVVSSGTNKSETNEYVNIEVRDDVDFNPDEFKNLNNYPTGTYKVTAQSGLFIRTGPGINYDKVGSGLSTGTVITVTKTDGQWGKISQGWVCLDYAALVTESGNASSGNGYSSSSSYNVGYYTVNAKSGLNVRSAPGTSSRITAGLSNGTKVAVREISGNWGKCDSGWICLDYATYAGSLEPVINVPAAPKLNRTSAENAACGTSVNVTWNPAADATCYDVYLKDGNGTVCDKTIGTTGNSAAFTVNNAGTYYVTVYSRNTKHTSAVSNSVKAVFHNPSTVTFKDWNGNVISKQTVAYGGSATTPSNPSRYGWTFKRWNGSYTNVTQNQTVNAYYERNIYTVTFLDESGNVIGKKQKIEFEGKATSPEYSVPEGYDFLGWDKKFDCIESDLTVNPVIKWSNDDLPVTIRSNTTAVRGKTGYTVNAIVRNNPNKETDGRVIVALKTTEGKLLSSTESAAFHLKKSEDKTIEVFMPYDRAATVAEIYVVEKFSTAIPISAVLRKTIDQGTAWTNWSTEKNPADAYQSESRKEYSYRTKSTTSSSKSSLSGWTKYDVSSKWSSYGSWSGWTDSYIASSDSRQVETRTVKVTDGYTEYRYGSYYNGSKSYFCPCHITGEWLRYTEWSTTRHTPNKYSAWYCPNIGYFDNYRINGKDYYWEESRYIEPTYKTQYRYRDRTLEYTYYFYQWSDWSDWSTTPVSATSTKEVKSRTTYRYIANDPNLVADTSGELRTISGKVDSSLAGEQAILFIYKIDEASDFTNEYVGQTKIGSDGSYKFSFKLREEPSIKTGDYTVTLGIEGTNAVIHLDPIKAPKPEYTVTYLDWDGKVLSTQKVTEGENATPPANNPSREGYDFICWNNTATNVRDDMTVSPVYKIKTYSVVFVDWHKESIDVQTYEHGQPLIAPVLEDSIDETVLGWDAVIEGTTTVTQDMVITACYEAKTFTVDFLDSDNTVLDSQTVRYGESVEAPQSLSSENTILFDWESTGSLAMVTEDQTVIPVYHYKETVCTPSSNVVTGEYIKAQTVKLLCENENAVIYYSLNGEDPLVSGTEYTGPFIVASSCELKFAACAFEMNDSEIVTEYIAINDGSAKNSHIVTVYGECWSDGISMLATEGETLGFNKAEYTRDGYDFDGAYTDIGYTDEWNLETDAVTESMELFFRWTPKAYKATFIGFDGKILDEQTVSYSGYAEMPQIPAVDGYVFCGFDKESLSVKEDTTFTAKYIPEDEFVTVSLDKSKHRLFKDSSITLVATLTPSDGENSYVYWTSDNENVAIVDDNGKVTAVGAGKTEIYAISSVTGYAAACEITVVSADDEELTLIKGVAASLDSEGQLRGISAGENTVAKISLLFENTDLVFIDINGYKLEEDDYVGTGTTVKLADSDKDDDGLVIVITGDMNGDGKINNRDSSMVIRYLVDKEVASLAQWTAIDVNGDGKVNNRDASMISRYLVGKEIF